MGESTKIQWAQHTFNPWRGCTKIASGCVNCYADAQSKRNPATLGIWGPNGTRVVASEAMWRAALKWNRDASFHVDLGDERPRVFCASLADVFEDWKKPILGSRGDQMAICHGCGRLGSLDEAMDCGGNSDSCERMPRPSNLDDVRARLFRTIDATPNLDWLLLTKRPENIRRMWPGVTIERDDSFSPPKDRAFAKCRPNVWLGTSIACQEDADRNVPELLKCRDLCAKTFLSIEPLIEPVDLEKIAGPESGKYASALHRDHDDRFYQLRGAPIDWVIVGGESGPNARPCNIAWIRSIVRQCRDAGVPCFVKQLGANAQHAHGEPLGWPERTRLRDPKGGDPAEWPEDVRVREVPISTPA